MNRELSITCLFLCLGLLSLPAEAGDTYWQHDPSEPADWFDPANWTAGTPGSTDHAYVDNGGTAEILGYHVIRGLTVGLENTGAVCQQGGYTQIIDWMFLGWEAGTQGTFAFLDGGMGYGYALVGALAGDGLFLQSGGAITGNILYVGGLGPTAGLGELPLGSGTGRYVQTAGTHRSAWLHVGAVPVYGEQGQGTYELAGGQLESRLQRILEEGVLSQTAGRNAVEFLDISEGRYEYFGGSLEVARGLNAYGEFDFGGSSSVLAIDTGLLNFGGANLLNSQDASISSGQNSLVIFPGAFDPATQLEAFSPGGLVHFAGDDLVIPPGQGFEGAGTIDDFVDCRGWIEGSATWAIYLEVGLFVHDGASADLGTGRLQVATDRSGIEGGLLRTNKLTIKPMRVLSPVPAVFRQTGGEVRVDIYGTSLLSIDGGQYHLSGGRLETGRVELDDEAIFTQTGGVHQINKTLHISDDAAYLIRGGSVFAPGVTVNEGMLAILDPVAQVSIGRCLVLIEAVLDVAPGSTIRITGERRLYPGDPTTPPRIVISDCSPGNLAGLSDLTLILEAGPDEVAEFEVAGEDRGPTTAGYFENFALEGLTLGGNDLGRVKLVDRYDNQVDGEGNEALYVHNLVLEPGATIDLNGLKLYFCNDGWPKRLFEGDANLTGDVDLTDLTILANNWSQSPRGWGEGDANGDGSVDLLDLTLLANNWEAGGSSPVPEPAAAALIVAGAAVLLRRRRVGR